jgi:ubiquinone biosynthesis protein
MTSVPFETLATKATSSRRPVRRARHRPHDPAGSELRTWLALIDSVLVGVERLAWDLRTIAERAAAAWGDSRSDLAALHGEVTDWRVRLLRLHKSGWMLTQLAAGYRLFALRAAFVPRRRAEAMLERLHARSAASFRRTSIEQGGAFLKVGQLLSARADLLPEVWVRELSTLQDDAKPVALQDVRATIERELGGTLEQLVAAFDELPIAAASIGQVHRAITHRDEVVAVKVQRPAIASLIEADLDLLELFVEGMRSTLPPADYDTIVAEIRAAIRAELDYAKEAQVTGRMADFFANVPGVLVPRPIVTLCSPEVLTTTFIQGRKIAIVLDALRARAAEGDASAHAELSELLGRLLQVYLRQVLQAGLFQADPHPGNFLVTEDGQLALLDFGCSIELRPATRRRYLALLRAFLSRDRASMAEHFVALGFATRTGDPSTLHTFADALLSQLAKAAGGQRLSWPDRDDLLQGLKQLLHAVEDDPVVKLPGEFVMLARVFGTLGGLFGHYRPDIDYARHVLPVLAAAFVDHEVQ